MGNVYFKFILCSLESGSFRADHVFSLGGFEQNTRSRWVGSRWVFSPLMYIYIYYLVYRFFIICNQVLWSSICFVYLLCTGIVYYGFEMYSDRLWCLENRHGTLPSLVWFPLPTHRLNVMDCVQIAFDVISLWFLYVEQRVMCIVTWMMLRRGSRKFFQGGSNLDV